MRKPLLFLATLVSSALAAAVVPVDAAPACSSVADQSAYEILALREVMTVLIIKCKRENEYNVNFIKRFQPTLQANEREVLSYFRRLYGGAGQGRKDGFTTELVNVLSQQANAQGTEYCGRNGQIIPEMNALRSMDELASYVATKDLAPVGMSMCPVTAARAAAPPKRR
jgi:hypothetical protein